MRVENPKLVVEPGAGRTGKQAMVAYQFQYSPLFPENNTDPPSRGAFQLFAYDSKYASVAVEGPYACLQTCRSGGARTRAATRLSKLN